VYFVRFTRPRPHIACTGISQHRGLCELFLLISEKCSLQCKLQAFFGIIKTDHCHAYNTLNKHSQQCANIQYVRNDLTFGFVNCLSHMPLKAGLRSCGKNDTAPAPELFFSWTLLRFQIRSSWFSWVFFHKIAPAPVCFKN